MSTVRPAPRSSRTIPASTPRDVQAGFASIWVSNGPSRTVTRINPSTGAISATVTVPDPASVLAIGADSVWLTSYPGNSLTRIDPTTNTVSGTISLAPGGLDPIGVTEFDGYVWVANHDGNPTGSVAKIDPTTMQVVDLIPVGTESTAGPTTIVSGAGSLWVNVANISGVVRIDPSTDQTIATIPVKGACAGMAANVHAVWVADVDDDGCPSGFPGITRIDTATNTVTARLDAGGSTGAVALDGDTLWYGTTEATSSAASTPPRTRSSANSNSPARPSPSAPPTASSGSRTLRTDSSSRPGRTEATTRARGASRRNGREPGLRGRVLLVEFFSSSSPALP